jgi:hypothetical protein
MITNQSKYLNDSLKIYLFSDSTLPIYQCGINTTDSSAIIKDFIGGYIKVDCIFNTKKDSVIGYRYGDTLSKRTKNESGVTIYPYKIVTSDSNSSEIMSEILNIVQTNDYFADFQNKKLGVDFIDCFLPPNYLTTTNRYLIAIVTKWDEDPITHKMVIKYITFFGIPKQKVIDKIRSNNPGIDDRMDYTFQFNTPIKHNEAASYFIGNEKLKLDIASSDYGKITENRAALNANKIISVRLKDEVIFGLYSFFPHYYIIVIIISVVLFFLFRNYIYQIKKQELALKESEKKFISITENSPDSL